LLPSVALLPSARLPAIDPCSVTSVQKNGRIFWRRASGVSAQYRL
jgi:hypothetical protein